MYNIQNKILWSNINCIPISTSAAEGVKQLKFTYSYLYTTFVCRLYLVNCNLD